MSAHAHPAYHGPAQPGSPFRLSRPDFTPLPSPTRTLTVWADRMDGGRRVGTWTEYDPATGAIIAEGCEPDDTAEALP
jgi:hypothetical protein